MAVKNQKAVALVFCLFLSRLCGGEDELYNIEYQDTFLSRLCGGEVCQAFHRAMADFLSRLCGGEEQLSNIYL